MSARKKQGKKSGKQKWAKGVKDGDRRFTCVLRVSDNQLLHDWAATVPGLTFRDVMVTACREYIDRHIKPAAEDGHKIMRPRQYDDDVWEMTLADYESLYEPNVGGGEFLKYL